MRKINKSSNEPATLKNAPRITKPDEVNPAIYKADDVREQLINDQYSKCAYCECKLIKEYNDVEHYRPKNKDMYWWLGHTWSNLLYACNYCNRSCKKDNFPLENDSTRFNLDLEQPLIINPSIDNPLDHIAFNRYMIVPLMINGIEDNKGKTTIDILKLNRKELINERKKVYETYVAINNIMRCAQSIQLNIITSGIADNRLIVDLSELLDWCDQEFNKLMSPSQAYSGMLLGQTKV